MKEGKPVKKVELYTDGACSGNPGPGGWGAILRYGEHEKELSGGAHDTTNNRMELTAVIEGLKALYGERLQRFQVLLRWCAEGLGLRLEKARLEKIRWQTGAQPRSVGGAAHPAGPPSGGDRLGQGTCRSPGE